MITLESAKQAFDTWRANKINTNTPIPVELWDMVDQLLPMHKKTELCKILGISSHQIQLHCTARSVTENRVSAPPEIIGDFIEATPPPSSGMAELTLKGESKSLHLCLSTSALSEILPMLGALL